MGRSATGSVAAHSPRSQAEPAARSQRRQAQGGLVGAQMVADSLDHDPVVITLVQTRDGDRPDKSRALDAHRETAAREHDVHIVEAAPGRKYVAVEGLFEH